MEQSIKKQILPIGAFLLPVCLVLDFIVALIKLLIDLMVFNMPLNFVRVLELVNLGNLISVILYITILVLSIVKKPQWLMLPFAAFSIFSVFSFISIPVKLFDAIRGGWFNIGYGFTLIIILLATAAELLGNLFLTFTALECFGKFNKPIFSKLWYIGGALFVVSLALNVIAEIFGLFSNEFFAVKMIIVNGIYSVVAFLPAILFAVSMFLIALWLGKCAKSVYDSKTFEDTTDNNVIENIQETEE